MSKTKSMILQCIGVFLAFLCIWWWVGREYKKTHPVKEVEQGITGPGKWIMLHGTCTVFGKSTHMKVYKGIWHKDYLEIIGR